MEPNVWPGRIHEWQMDHPQLRARKRMVGQCHRCPAIPRLLLSSFLAWSVKPRFVLVHSRVEIVLLEKSLEEFRSQHGAPLTFFSRLSGPHCSAVPVARPHHRRAA
jgi:hypothetical protein